MSFSVDMLHVLLYWNGSLLTIARGGEGPSHRPNHQYCTVHVCQPTTGTEQYAPVIDRFGDKTADERTGRARTG